jgi:uncharacterized membrane protein
MTDPTIVGYSVIGAFFFLLGFVISKIEVDNDNSRLIKTIGTIASYCFSGLIMTVIAFIVMELGAAAAYQTLLRSVFIFMMITTGTIAGIGGFVASIMLIVLMFSSFFGKKRGDY